MVLAALQSTEAIAGGFNLATRAEVLPAWPRRGQPGILNDAGGFYTLALPPCWLVTDDREDTDAVVRCSPGEDGTNGFFVSCFVRRSDAHLSVSDAEMPAAGCNNDPGAESAKKRKLHAEGERDRTSAPPTSGGRRKKRK